MRDVEEQMGHRAGLMESKMGSIECRLKILEVKMDERHGEIMAMFQKLTINSNNHSQGKLGDETLIRVRHQDLRHLISRQTSQNSSHKWQWR